MLAFAGMPVGDSLLTAQGKPEDDYRVQGIVGVGSFGVVRKVQHGHPGLDPKKDSLLARLDWIAGGYTVHDHTVAPVCSLQHVPAQVSKHRSHASHESSGQAESTQWRCLGSQG